MCAHVAEPDGVVVVDVVSLMEFLITHICLRERARARLFAPYMRRRRQ